MADGVYTDAQATRGAAVYDGACSGCHRADLGGAHGPSLKEQRFAQRIRRQRSENAVHESRDDDAAERAGKPRRQRLSRHRRAPAERERISRRLAGAHRRRARRHPRCAGKTEAASSGRRFLLRRSGGLPHRGPAEHVDADEGERAGRGGPACVGAHRRPPQPRRRSARRRFTCWMRWPMRPTITRATRCTSAAC